MVHLTPSSMKRRITMFDNKEAAIIGEVNRVPIKVGPVTFKPSYLVVQATPYHLSLGVLQ